MSKIKKIYKLKSLFQFHELLRIFSNVSLKLTATGSGLVIAIFTSRLIGEESFGRYVTIFAIAGLISAASSLGLPALLQRELSKSLETKSSSSIISILHICIVINTVLIACLFLFYLFEYYGLALAVLYCILGNLLGLGVSIYKAHDFVNRGSIYRDLIKPIFTILFLFLLGTILEKNYLLPIYAHCVGFFIALILMLALKPGKLFDWFPNFKDFKRINFKDNLTVRAAIIFSATQVLINLTTQIDIFIVSYFGSPTDLAHYYAAVRGALVINFLFASAGILAEPRLTRAYARKDFEEYNVSFNYSRITGAILTIICFIVLIIFGKSYLNLYGEGYISAYNVLILFGIGILFRSFFGPMIPLHRATGFEADLLKYSIYVLILNFIISISLFPYFGVAGVAFGSALQFAVQGFLLWNNLKNQGVI